ncbi:MAG: aminotransferase class III-fold pyridoxal phosphate-dependent enzyme [Armatimonadetes bacterium]|nr:aminotransferase class III-fold pyridoxal phosphate-dependent enzyme [Armatimonadota bacterium]
MSNAEQITQDVIEKYQRFVNPTQVALLKIGGYDHIEHRAEGVVVTDLDGNEYLDCLGGYGIFSLGHRHPKVVEAVKRQLDLMPLASKTFLNKPLADLCARLAEIAPGDLQYAFLCNSGTEAVEGALKIARMATGRTDCIATVGAYHGKTLGSLSATGRELYRKPFAPMVPGFSHVPWNDAAAIEDAITENTAAVIVEPVQGEGGIQVPSDDYLPRVQDICRRRGVLLIADEVQTGLGRTGKMFAVEHWGVTPDIMTLAKALGGGVMPVGAFLATPDIWEKVFHENPFIHTSTFGGGELACAAALAALDVTLTEDLPRRAAENGAYFLEGLRRTQAAHPNVLQEARGLGLMLGVEFTDSDIGKLVIGTMVHRGVIAAYTLNNPKVIRFEPPLIITRAQIDQVLEVFEAGIQDALALLGDLIE